MTGNTADDVFGPVAELYEEVRPDYPRPLVADLLELANLPTGGRMLEIGCGTGKATRMVAASGFSLTAIDPSPRMLAVARRVCAGFPNVEFVESRFEDVQASTRFDLVYAAMSWHWVDHAIAYGKAASLLRPGGLFALFTHGNYGRESPLRPRLDAVYRRLAPDLKSPAPGSETRSNAPQALAESGLFEPPLNKTYRWRGEVSSETWVRFLQTTSDHQAYPADRRKRLLEAIKAEIDDDGGVFRFEVESELTTARRTATGT